MSEPLTDGRLAAIRHRHSDRPCEPTNSECALLAEVERLREDNRRLAAEWREVTSTLGYGDGVMTEPLPDPMLRRQAERNARLAVQRREQVNKLKAQLIDALAENKRLRAATKWVRVLHTPLGGGPLEGRCQNCCYASPCPTIRALDGETP